MTKFKIINFIDKLFITFSSFLVIYAWINFYIRDILTTFILSLIFSVSCTYILFWILEKKKNKKLLSAKEKEEINKNFLAFRIMPLKEKIALVNKILSINFETKANSKCIIYNNNEETHTIIFATNLTQINQENLINILEEHSIKTTHLEIVCQDMNSNVNCKFLNNLKIEFINKTKLYNDFFKKHNIFPNTSILNNKELKFNWKMVFKNLLHEQKAKRYFILGFVLIFSSLILPFKTYYLIFGTAFLICSILCKILAKFKT